ncbi:unnamed protein product [Prorocentrum cordatum]|uniref:Uncharacterized protein n=1 Tax=Prorocentrum cordatum TaxID=2364126 RepID=A0ABN9VWC6_9DINO|nr:unnamed protein product [Polarella glacialis]
MSSSTSHSRTSPPHANEGDSGGEGGDGVRSARGDSSGGNFWDSAAWGCRKPATTSTAPGGGKTAAPRVQIQGAPCSGTGDRATECSGGGGGLGTAASGPRPCFPEAPPRRARRAASRRRRAVPGTRRWATAATSAGRAACSLSRREPGAAAPARDRSQASQASRRLWRARRLAAGAPNAAASDARVEAGLHEDGRPPIASHHRTGSARERAGEAA